MNHDELIAEGLKAFISLQRRNRRGFDCGIAVGEGLNAGKQKLTERLELNSIENSQTGRMAYRLWLRESGYQAVPPEARAALAKILEPENLPRIMHWIGTLSDKQRLRWHHPTTIWSNWQRHIGSVQMPRPVLVAMRIDATKKVTKQISENTHDAELDDYIALVSDLVAFAADKYGQSREEVLDLITQEATVRPR